MTASKEKVQENNLFLILFPEMLTYKISIYAYFGFGVYICVCTCKCKVAKLSYQQSLTIKQWKSSLCLFINILFRKTNLFGHEESQQYTHSTNTWVMIVPLMTAQVIDSHPYNHHQGVRKLFSSSEFLSLTKTEQLQ